MPQPSKNTMQRLQTVPTKIPDINTNPLFDHTIKKDEFKVVSDQKVIFTQDKAAWYIDLPVFEAEREVTETHVQTLYDEMANGRFNANIVIIATAMFKGKVYKINGQHCCWAKFFLPNYTPEVREMVFEVNTEEELKRLYSTFDRGKPRSENHLIRVQLAGSDVAQGITSDIISRLSSAIKLWLYENLQDHRRAKSFDVAELIQTKYATLFRQVGVFLYKLPSKKDAFWKRSAVLAAMFETFNKSREVSEEFWDRVISGENLSKHDARMMLRNYLLETALHAGAKKGKKATDSETMYRCCVNAWNKFRKGEDIEIMRSTDTRVKAR